MNFIRPSFEIWEQEYNLDSIWSHIARCVRVCYQSETRKNPSERDEEFVKRVILRNKPWNNEANHLAMLEHGTIYLFIPWNEYYNKEANFRYFYNKYSKHNRVNGVGVYITTNLRVIIEHDWEDDLKYICIPTEHHARRVTVSFTTNIGVSREFNRHRVNSIAEESTRYCNYNKTNNGQLNIGLPAWLLGEEYLSYIERHQFDKLSISCCQEILNDNTDINPYCWCDMDFYLFSLTVSQWCYNWLIKKGWKPQQAREVLPLATKTQLVHTAFIEDWKHFFALRSKGISGIPHPNAQLLAKPLEEEFSKRGYI